MAIHDLRELALNYVCPYCSADSGVWCKTKSGRRASMMHSWRTEPLRIIWNVGYHEGIQVEKRWRDSMQGMHEVQE